MRIIVDKIPEKPKDCIFSRYDYKYDGLGRLCSLNKNTYCRYTEDCPYLKSIQDYKVNELSLQVGDRVQTTKGVGTIDIVNNDTVIVSLDGDQGKYYFYKEDCKKVDIDYGKE